MNIYKEIEAEILNASNIVITAHKSPDGDSIGSSLGLLRFIQKLGKEAAVCHPDPAPVFLQWVDVSAIIPMTEQPKKVADQVNNADLIFCLDYNSADRVGENMQVLLENSKAKKIMIDHHLDPADFADIMVSEVTASSTSELIVELIVHSGNESLLDEHIGRPLYLGILTDTGAFRFSSVRPRTHEILAALLKAGVRHHLIHEVMNDNNTLSRLRLQGFALSEKLEVLDAYKVGIIGLSKEELEKYSYQKGDTDTLANQILSIKGMKAGIVFTERDGMIKISFRSKGGNHVNTLAAEHFDGGGHANAAGGRSDLSVQETIDKLKRLVPEYFG